MADAAEITVDVDQIVLIGKNVNSMSHSIGELAAKVTELQNGQDEVKKDIAQLVDQLSTLDQKLDATEKSLAERQDSFKTTMEEKIAALEEQYLAECRETKSKVTEQWATFEHSLQDLSAQTTQFAAKVPFLQAHAEEEARKVATDLASFRNEMSDLNSKNQASWNEQVVAIKKEAQNADASLAEELKEVRTQLGSTQTQFAKDLSQAVNDVDSRLGELIAKMKEELQAGSKSVEASAKREAEDIIGTLRKDVEAKQELLDGKLKTFEDSHIGFRMTVSKDVELLKKECSDARTLVDDVVKRENSKLSEDIETFKQGLQKSVAAESGKLSDDLSTLKAAVETNSKSITDLTASRESLEQTLRNEARESISKSSAEQQACLDRLQKEMGDRAGTLDTQQAQQKIDLDKNVEEGLAGLRAELSSSIAACEGNALKKIEMLTGQVSILLQKQDVQFGSFDTKLNVAEDRMREVQPWRARANRPSHGMRNFSAGSMSGVSLTSATNTTAGSTGSDVQANSAKLWKRPGSAPPGGRRREEKWSEFKATSSVGDMSMHEGSQFLQESSKVLPGMDAATDALSRLDKRSLSEVKSFKHPPELVTKTMCAVMTALGLSPSWAMAKLQLNDVSTFMAQLRTFDKDCMSDLTVRHLAAYTKDPVFVPMNVKKVSVVAGVLCEWVHAITHHAETRRLDAAVEPKRQEPAMQDQQSPLV